MGRERTFNIRLSEEEWARLDFLATHYGLNAAAMIRMLLKKEENEVRARPPKPDPRWNRMAARAGLEAATDASLATRERDVAER
jgi:hypothetical protein